MATIAVLRVPAADTYLGTTFDRLPALECEIEQTVGAEAPGHWFDGVDRADLEAAFEADRTVEDYDHVATENGRLLYALEGLTDADGLYDRIVAEGGTVLSAVGTNGRWTVRLRFPDHDAVSRAYDRLSDGGISVDLVRIHELSPDTASDLDLTDEQYEALATAIDHGYFDIPRAVTMEELAAKLDISHQALSERLRRAYHTLVTAEVDAGAAEDETPLEGQRN